MSEPLQINKKEAEAAFTMKPTYEVLLMYEITVKPMCIAVNLLDIGADSNLMHPSIISNYWNYRIMCHDHPRMRTATEGTLQVDGLILPHLRLGDLCTPVWFDIRCARCSWNYSGHRIHRSVYSRKFLNWMKSCTLEMPASPNSSTRVAEHVSQRGRFKYYASEKSGTSCRRCRIQLDCFRGTLSSLHTTRNILFSSRRSRALFRPSKQDNCHQAVNVW